MDSGNSGSISSTGDEEYDHDSRAAAAAAAADDGHSSLFFLNHHHPIPTHFGSSSSSSHHPSLLFDISSSNSYLYSLPQSQPNPYSMLNNLDNTATSHPAAAAAAGGGGIMKQYSSFLGPHQDNNNNARLPAAAAPSSNNINNNNASSSSAAAAAATRNPKKRTRASRRAPTTVLTTDTTNFRSMVQEFTGIPAPPFSASYSHRRLDLFPIISSSSLRSTASLHLDTNNNDNAFHPNPFLPSSSSNSRLLHNNMVDAHVTAPTTTNATSFSATANNSHVLPPDLGLPYHHHHHQLPQNMNLSMQDHLFLGFNPPFNTVPAGFGAKSQASLSMLPLHEDMGISHHHHHQVNEHDVVATTGIPLQPQGHNEHVAASDDISLRSSAARDDGRRDPSGSLDNNNGGKVA